MHAAVYSGSALGEGHRGLVAHIALQFRGPHHGFDEFAWNPVHSPWNDFATCVYKLQHRCMSHIVSGPEALLVGCCCRLLAIFGSFM